MGRQVAVRLALGLATLWIVSLLLFFGTDALPGDTATAILGQRATPELLAELRAELGLNAPAWSRYVDWVTGFASGDLGVSPISNRPVSELIRPLIANTIVLAVATILVLVPLAVLFGAASAILRDRLFDQATAVATLALISLPEFVVGNLLVLALAVGLPLLPAVSILDPARPAFLQPSFLVLPVLTLLAAAVAQTIRMVRATLIDVLHSDFVELARLKGVPEHSVILRHALPNALAPTIQVIVLNVAWLLGGVVIVEAVFQYPGIGAAMVRAVANRDLPSVQAIGMFITGSFVVLNLLADVVVIVLNPRLRSQA
jgi:peptide/nickel transport system permease protein